MRRMHDCATPMCLESLEKLPSDPCIPGYTSRPDQVSAPLWLKHQCYTSTLGSQVWSKSFERTFGLDSCPAFCDSATLGSWLIFEVDCLSSKGPDRPQHNLNPRIPHFALLCRKALGADVAYVSPTNYDFCAAPVSPGTRLWARCGKSLWLGGSGRKPN